MAFLNEIVTPGVAVVVLCPLDSVGNGCSSRYFGEIANLGLCLAQVALLNAE